jgi:hypothetical protein
MEKEEANRDSVLADATTGKKKPFRNGFRLQEESCELPEFSA